MNSNTFRIFSSVFILLFICFYGCGIEKKEKDPSIKHNYVVLLDLSDRILKQDQITRDKDLIVHIYDSFLNKLKEELYFAARDEFKIAIAHQDEGVKDAYVYQMLDQFYINAETVHLSKKVKIKDGRDKLLKNLDNLYKEAYISDNPNDYNGANIHSYLGEEFEGQIYRDSLTKNFLFIITDGYQYVKGQSGGLNDWKEVGDLEDVQVMVLEMDPNKSRPNEAQLMKSKWGEWLNNMNAQSVKLEQKGSIRMIKESVNKFLFEDEIIHSGNTKPELKGEDGIKKKENELIVVSSVPLEQSVEENEIGTLEVSSVPVANPQSKQENSLSQNFQEESKELRSENLRTNAVEDRPNIKVIESSALMSIERTGSKTTEQLKNYADTDNDGVIDTEDHCIKRKGSKANVGCPIIKINRSSEIIYPDMEDVSYEISNTQEFLSDDLFVWSVNKGARIINNTSQRSNISYPEIGKYEIRCRVIGEDNYKDEVYQTEYVRVRKSLLETHFNRIVDYGNVALLGSDSEIVKQKKTQANKSEEYIRSLISPEGLDLVKERKSQKTTAIFGDNLNSLLNYLKLAKSDPKLEIDNLVVESIDYDINNGLINSLKYSVR